MHKRTLTCNWTELWYLPHVSHQVIRSIVRKCLIVYLRGWHSSSGHSDVVHAVESEHRGKGDSSVLYIPAIPLTVNNAHYLKDQVSRFKQGLPPSDFPGGDGESQFIGRQKAEDIEAGPSRQLLGLEAFPYPPKATPGAKRAIDKSNEILFS